MYPTWGLLSLRSLKAFTRQPHSPINLLPALVCRHFNHCASSSLIRDNYQFYERWKPFWRLAPPPQTGGLMYHHQLVHCWQQMIMTVMMLSSHLRRARFQYNHLSRSLANALTKLPELLKDSYEVAIACRGPLKKRKQPLPRQLCSGLRMLSLLHRTAVVPQRVPCREPA